MSEPIQPETPVLLKEGYERVYTKLKPGARGVVKDRKVDDYGFPLVFVEWDKGTTNGEPDGWTFESHFNVLDGSKIVEQMVQDATDRATCDECGEIHDDEDFEQYFDTLTAATDAAADAEGFFVLAIRTEVDSAGRTIYIPHIYADCLSEVATAMIEAQLMQIASASFNEMSMESLIRALRKRQDES